MICESPKLLSRPSIGPYGEAETTTSWTINTRAPAFEFAEDHDDDDDDDDDDEPGLRAADETRWRSITDRRHAFSRQTFDPGGSVGSTGGSETNDWQPQDGERPLADYYPLITLAIGVATVIGMIMVLRINAFIALITAAIVVSLMSPGAVADKISRVASAFGGSAGSIAIVIALAAVIGECMMASGAADRIVQFFLRMLGEKRASWALMSSGFVLAVPVFFDTVFYLLVPLARSLFKRTRKNYLLYILAIAAGGAITHTLVPPTPGPLVMASTLGIDLGKMIFVGVIVALPAAIAGLICARVMDRVLDVPFRELETDQLPDDVVEAHPDSAVSLPPLWLASLPVLLPVVLIGANTALSTMADGERPARLSAADITDWSAFAAAVNDDASDSHLAAERLLSQVDESARTALTSGQTPSADEQAHIVDEFNRLLAAPGKAGVYDDAAFETVVEPGWKIARDSATATAASDAAELTHLDTATAFNSALAMDRSSLKLHERERLNRLALETAFPSIQSHVWDTPARKAADVAALFGNANLALLFSAAIAMYLLVRQRGLSLKQLSSTVEDALAGGGVIILITAAGGAFGAMLKISGIREFIEAQFAASNADGLMYLFLGYLIAVVMKVAVGSSTVAMITVSSMLAAMIGGGGGLGFDPVYLATAIGAGSLMGSWMLQFAQHLVSGHGVSRRLEPGRNRRLGHAFAQCGHHHVDAFAAAG